MTIKKQTVVLVGCGHLGQAMLTAWHQKLSHAFRFVVIGRRKKLPHLPKGVPYFQSHESLPKKLKPAVVIFSTRPQQMDDAMKLWANYNCLFISVAAGRTIKSMHKHLGPRAKIIRTMPNLPANIGMAMTGLVANRYAFAKDKVAAFRLMSSIGEAVWLPHEKHLDAVTALSGSGPGYVFLFANALVNAAKSIGLPHGLIDPMVRQTLAGSAQLLKQSDSTAEELCRAIATKGGTTEAAFNVFLKNKQFPRLITKGLKAARTKAQQIGKKYE